MCNAENLCENWKFSFAASSSENNTSVSTDNDDGSDISTSNDSENNTPISIDDDNKNDTSVNTDDGNNKNNTSVNTDNDNGNNNTSINTGDSNDKNNTSVNTGNDNGKNDTSPDTNNGKVTDVKHDIRIITACILHTRFIGNLVMHITRLTKIVFIIVPSLTKPFMNYLNYCLIFVINRLVQLMNLLEVIERHLPFLGQGILFT